MLAVVIGIGSVVLFAAVLLWSIEGLARLIGAKRTALLLLVFLPGMCDLAVAYLNRANDPWWTFVVYPLAGPLVVCALIVLGYVAVSPFGVPDLLGLICHALERGYRALRRLIGSERA